MGRAQSGADLRDQQIIIAIRLLEKIEGQADHPLAARWGFGEFDRAGLGEQLNHAQILQGNGGGTALGCEKAFCMHSHVLGEQT